MDVQAVITKTSFAPLNWTVDVSTEEEGGGSVPVPVRVPVVAGTKAEGTTTVTTTTSTKDADGTSREDVHAAAPDVPGCAFCACLAGSMAGEHEA